MLVEDCAKGPWRHLERTYRRPATQEANSVEKLVNVWPASMAANFSKCEALQLVSHIRLALRCLCMMNIGMVKVVLYSSYDEPTVRMQLAQQTELG